MGLSAFIQNFIYAYVPLIGGGKVEQRELRRIINRMKKRDKLLVDPVQLKARALFSQLIVELSEISSRLKKLYEGNIEGSQEELKSFETDFCTDLLEKGNLSLELLKLRSIVKSAHDEGQGGINTVDRIFKSRMKYFSHKNFKVGRHLLERNAIYSAVAAFDFSIILDYIPLEKNNKTGSFSLEPIEKELLDLYYVISVIPEKKAVVINDPLILLAYDKNELSNSYPLDILQGDINRLHDIFKGPLSADFLKELVFLLQKNREIEEKEFSAASTFPKEIYDDLVEKYRIDREKFINIENEKVLQTRMNSLFKDRHLEDLQIYNVDTSNLFHQGGLSSFRYVIPMRIIKSFNRFFYSPFLQPVLQEFQVEAEYFNKKQKEEFQESVESYESLKSKVKKFEEDLTIPSFSELLPYVDALRDAFLDNKAKTKGREAVRKVNGRADRLIQESFTSLITLHGHLVNINVDMHAAVPKLLSNTLYMKKKEEFLAGLEEAADLLNKYIKLLKIFAVHVDKARQSVQGSTV